MKHFCSFIIIITLFAQQAFALATHESRFWKETPEQDNNAAVSAEMFALFMAVQDDLPTNEVKVFWKELADFTAALQQKKARYKDEEAFVKYLFYKVHRHYLKRYRYQTNLYQLFDKGYYDCVTGTALYAMLLDAMHIQYQIHETPFHVYMVAYTGKDSVLLESTDPQGFISGNKAIASALKMYSKSAESSQANQEQQTYEYNFNINEHIDLQQLAGLNYFNQAVEHYNHQQLEKANQYLRQAKILYPAKRMDALQSLIYQTARKISYSR